MDLFTSIMPIADCTVPGYDLRHGAVAAFATVIEQDKMRRSSRHGNAGDNALCAQSSIISRAGGGAGAVGIRDIFRIARPQAPD
jgi:hypothetical protein